MDESRTVRWSTWIRCLTFLLIGVILGTYVDRLLFKPEVQQVRDLAHRLQNEFIEPMPEGALLEHAARGFAAELRPQDPHIEYFPPLAARSQDTRTFGELVGIGIEYVREERGLRVLTVFEDSPALAGGMRVEDLIVQVDGWAITTEAADDDIRSRLLGEAGTEVKVEVERAAGDPGETARVLLTLTRARVVLPALTDAWLEGKILHIYLKNLGSHVVGQLRERIDKAKQNGLRGLILDLRMNGGGLLTTGAELSDLFLERGGIVDIRSRHPGLDEPPIVASQEGTVLPGVYPMIVLVDDGTASAAEIIAGALQGNGRAQLMGMRTYGKGSVQNWMRVGEKGTPLENAKLKYTIAHWYLPGRDGTWRRLSGGVDAQGNRMGGLEPDLAVLPSDDEDMKTAAGRRAYDARVLEAARQHLLRQRQTE